MKVFSLILFMLCVLNISAQNYDLIITTKGDSIACHIDSVTNTNVFFEMKVKNTWVHTSLKNQEYNSYSYNTINKKQVIFKPESSYIDYFLKPTTYQHSDRYFFAPSAYSIEKGTFRYSTYFYLAHDLQYGFSDKFSVIVGTSVIFNPAYIIPSFTFKINEKSAFTVGDMYLTPTYTDVFAFNGNLLYGMHTRGSINKNFSIGAGLWTTFENEQAAFGMSPAISISGMFKTSNKWYFITENYAFQMPLKESAGYYNDLNERLYDENFEKKNLYIGGLSGFRLIPRKKPHVSWQFGFAYILSFFDDAPEKYNDPHWQIFNEDDDFAIVLSPFFSYSIKL